MCVEWSLVVLQHRNACDSGRLSVHLANPHEVFLVRNLNLEGKEEGREGELDRHQSREEEREEKGAEKVNIKLTVNVLGLWSNAWPITSE